MVHQSDFYFFLQLTQACLLTKDKIDYNARLLANYPVFLTYKRAIFYIATYHYADAIHNLSVLNATLLCLSSGTDVL